MPSRGHTQSACRAHTHTPLTKLVATCQGTLCCVSFIPRDKLYNPAAAAAASVLHLWRPEQTLLCTTLCAVHPCRSISVYSSIYTAVYIQGLTSAHCCLRNSKTRNCATYNATSAGAASLSVNLECGRRQHATCRVHVLRTINGHGRTEKKEPSNSTQHDTHATGCVHKAVHTHASKDTAKKTEPAVAVCTEPSQNKTACLNNPCVCAQQSQRCLPEGNATRTHNTANHAAPTARFTPQKPLPTHSD